MKRKHIVIFVVSLLAVACFSSLLTMTIVNNDVNKKIEKAVKNESAYYKSLLNGLDTFLEVKSLVDFAFVDDVKYDDIDTALSEYYVSLLGDKYSEYLTKEELDAYMNKISGSFVGIGIVFSSNEGVIHVEEVVEGSPAKEAGILPGENIVKVNEIDVNEETLEEATSSVAGEEGTKVTLVVEAENGSRRTVFVERRRINNPTVKSIMLEDNVGYVRISQFSYNTADAFEQQLDDLLGKGAKGIIFDVRSNSGGELEAVSRVLDRILPEGPILNIIYGDGTVEAINSTAEKSLSIPMVVLVNERTASAAELFAAALRDYKLAQLYGTTTYGKGYMQTIRQLTDGSGLKLSIAKYNPPCGENYEGVGVAPHVTVTDDISTEIDEQFEEAKKYFNNK